MTPDPSHTDRSISAQTRRTFLQVAAATGGLAGLGGASTQQGPETIELRATLGFWEGVAPESIAGEKNPTLDLEPDTRYRVVWTNADGFDHNFVIINGEGDQLVRTEILSDRGATQSVEFEATEAMAEYFCEIHPNSMRGIVSTDGDAAVEQRDPRIPPGPEIGLEPVAEGLTAPLGFEYADEEGDRNFVVDQTGQVYVLGDDGLRDDPFLDVSDRIVDLGVPRLNGYDERGLLGLAFHPEFAENRTFYVRYSAPNREGTPENYDHTAVLAEFRATEDLQSADPDSERVLMEIPEPQMNHNGGAVAFGPDGYLYTSLGDGGGANDVGLGHVPDWYDRNEGGNGQDVTQNLLGSILRIDVDGQEGDLPYSIPDDNPLVGTEGRDELYAWGFRNPFRMSFNDGRLFVGDSGQNLWEEVDIVEKGGNYGWNVREGSHCFSVENPSEPDAITDCPTTTPEDVRGGEQLLDPIIEYRHRKSTIAFIDGSVVIGGYVYQNDALSELTGTYVFGNWSGQGVVEPDGEIFVATPPEGSDSSQTGDEGADTNDSAENATNASTSANGGQPSEWSMQEAIVAGTEDGQFGRYVYAFGRDADGELYVLSTGTFKPVGETGMVHKIVPPGEGAEVEAASGAERTTDAENETNQSTRE